MGALWASEMPERRRGDVLKSLQAPWRRLAPRSNRWFAPALFWCESRIGRQSLLSMGRSLARFVPRTRSCRCHGLLIPIGWSSSKLMPSLTMNKTSNQTIQPTQVYEVRPRKDKRGVDLISDALPFGRLRYGEPSAVSNAVGLCAIYFASLVWDSVGACRTALA